jgi:hypothetical protein
MDTPSPRPATEQYPAPDPDRENGLVRAGTAALKRLAKIGKTLRRKEAAE